MNKFKIIFFGALYSLIFFSNISAIENKILFKVNNEIITSMDVLTELKYLEIINKDFKKTSKKQGFEIAKRSLIREKIKEIELKKLKTEIEIDGGINFENSKIAIEAGANILVSGTTVFKSNNGDIKKNIDTLKSL